MDTMDADYTEMAKLYLKGGTTTWYPTTMTVSQDAIVRSTKANIKVDGGANIPGFHLEGPFINVKYKGAQNEKYVIKPTLELLKKADLVKKITVAPESDGAIEFIKNCPCVVSVGHTDTDYDTAKAAFEAGAKCLTHTYNCMPGTVVSLYNAFQAGNIPEVQRIQIKMNAFIKLMIKHGVIPSCKATLEYLGFDVGECTAPMKHLSAEEKAVLISELKEIGFDEYE
jgi:hypothetical protein